MIMLRALGSLLLLAADGGELRSITAQPKRIALLTYLAIASRSGSVRRDTVMALFWPELDTARARHALRQAIYQLRRELGPGVLDGNGDDQLRVDRAQLSCDVCEFADAVASGQWERALELYHGELLPGLYVAGCEEFEQWLERTRARVQAEALQAAVSLSERAAAAGRKDAAARWARRAHELAPYDEPVLRRLLEALAAAGDAGSAVRVFEAFATRCERELGVAPSAETTALVGTLRAAPSGRRKQRRTAALAGSGSVAAESVPALGPARPRWRPGPRALAILVALAALGTLAAAARRYAWSGVDPDLLAVLPFRVLAPAADSLVLTEGVAELLATTLQAGRSPRLVDPWVAAQRWSGALHSRSAAEDPGLPARVARELGAGLVLHGSAFNRGSDVVIAARLLDVRTGQQRTSRMVTGPADKLVGLVQQLATGTLGELVSEDPLRLEQLTSTDYRAVQSYLHGRAAARRGNYDDAIRHLQAALEIDSAFAAAALALIDVSGWSGRGDLGRYEQLAYRHRERLGPRDTAYLRAWVGYDYATGRASTGDLLRATEAAAAANPDRPEALYLLGDRFFHVGDFLGRTRAVFRSRALMERSVALDSGFNPGREHLLQLAVLTDDPAAVRRYRADLQLREPDGIRTPALLWVAAQYLGDRAEQRRLRAALDTVNSTALYVLVRDAQEYGLGLADAERAMRVLLARAGTAEEVSRAAAAADVLYRNLGRPSAAYGVLRPPPVNSSMPLGALLRGVQLALVSDMPPADAAAAGKELARRAAAPGLGERERHQRYRAGFGSLTWKLWQRDTTGVAVELTVFRAEPPFADSIGGPVQLTDREYRHALLDALLERATSALRPGRRPALLRLDSLAREGVSSGEVAFANAVLVKLYEEAGDEPGALAAARRRLRGTGNSLAWLAPTLRAEARLAAALGDKAAALDAYRHYLALRSTPEPALRPQLDSVRAEYRRLSRSPR